MNSHLLSGWRRNRNRSSFQNRLNVEILEPRVVLDSTVVFNEVMYNPAGDPEQKLEWIEFYNQLRVDMDISEWVLDGGVRYTFPDKTIVPGRGHLIVAADPVAFAQATGISGALGPWTGRLSNDGERLVLWNNDSRLMNEMTYADGGEWPVAADGGGASLSKRDQLTASHQSQNWTFSQGVGGTPSTDNVVKPGTFISSEILSEKADATAFVPESDQLGTTWTSATFDDSSWLKGKTAIGHEGRTGYDSYFGLDLDTPPDNQTAMPLTNKNTSVYIRVPFTVADGSSFDKLTLRMRYDDGFVAYINGTRVASANAPDVVGWSSASTASHADRDAVIYEDFDITAHAGLLRPGRNVLAIHGLNQTLTDNDSLYSPLLVTGTAVRIVDPVTLTFNEVAAGGSDAFFVEIANTGMEAVDLRDFVLASRGQQTREYRFASTVIPPGGVTSVDAARLGFRAQDGDFVGLYTPDRQTIADARRVTGRLRGRSLDLDGRWLYPSGPTPGTTNTFDVNQDVVINEIMYHAPPTVSVPAKQPTYSRNPLISLDATWRYSAAGRDLGNDWETRTHAVDNQTWYSGQTGIGFSTRPLANPIRTELQRPSENNPGFLTYYFQTDVNLTQETIDSMDALEMRHMVDSGAVFYINGTEVTRFNMPSGEIAFPTQSVVSTRDAELIGPFGLDRNLLKPGVNVISAEVHLRQTTSSDVYFALELTHGQELTPFVPGTEFAESAEEWIELYNKGSRVVDLTDWRLNDAVEFDFPVGTRINPGEYLVIANDAVELSRKYPNIRIAGSFQGTLANRDDNIQLIDPVGNIADEVHYFEAGRWDEAADGGGSSLELRDPDADNSKGEAWAPSNERDKAEWTTVSYTGVSRVDVAGNLTGANRFNELIFGLLDQGEFLIDDLEVIENPSGDAISLLQNGTFESDTIGKAPAKWRLIGTHSGTVVTDPTNPANKVLHVVTTGAQQHVHDHAETTFIGNRTIRDGNEYQIRFRAKWLSGNSQINTRLYFNRIPHTSNLDVPEKMGTPGARNTAFVENIGPGFDGFGHSPVTPLANQEVQVVVSADDPDGLNSVKLWYREDTMEWHSTDMSRRADGMYVGTIPGHDKGNVVQFYVEATDSAGLSATYPELGPDSRALFQVEDDRQPRSEIDRYRIIMMREDRTRLFEAVNRMSNWHIPMSFVHGEEPYYDVAVRQVGSRWIRPNSGYKISFDPEKILYGVHESVRLDINGMAEIVMKQMLNRAGGGKNSFYDDIGYLVSPNTGHSHEALVNLARFEDVFLVEQFGSTDGTKFELDDVVYPNGPVGGVEGLKANTEVNTSADIGVSSAMVRDQGANPEFYRAHLLIKNNRSKDDFTSIAQLAQGIHTQGDALFAASNAVMDVDLWMRHYANQSYFGNWDTYGFGRPKNLRMYVRPEDGKFVPFFWDCDLCNFTEAILKRSEPTSRLDEIRDIPHNLRLYWGHMLDLVNRSFNEEYVTRWATHYGEKAAGQQHGGDENFSGIIASTRTRTTQTLREIERAVPKVDFSITTNNGEPLTVNTNTVRLNGKGWIDIRRLRLAGSDRPLDAFWPEVNVWQVDVPLSLGQNTIQIEAVGFQGEVLATKAINVTSTVTNPLRDSLRITELNYNPGDPSAAERGLGYTDNDDFEFVELANIGTSALSLADAKFVRFDNGNQTEGFEYDFATSAIRELQPGERIVVVENAAAFRARYGADVKIAGEWSGALSNGSETITLLAQGAVLHQFMYDDDWYPETDGDGSTLEIFDAKTDLDAWTTQQGWRASIIAGGTPGTGPVIPGDANGDGRFNSDDLLIISQAGEYEDGVEDNSTFAEGDFSGDGDFTSLDVVLAFQYGAYVNAIGAAAIDRASLAARLSDEPSIDDDVTDLLANDGDRATLRESRDLRRARRLSDVRSIDSVFEQLEQDRVNDPSSVAAPELDDAALRR